MTQRRHERCDLASLREAPHVLLREDDPTVDAHDESAESTDYDRRHDAQRILELASDTRGVGTVASEAAVFDGDVHE
jgi:hypothetical protein